MQNESENGDRKRKEMFNGSKLTVILIDKIRIKKESVYFK